MSDKSWVTLGVIGGSIIGGYIPAFFGVGILSFTSLITGALGSIIGIIIANKIIHS